MADLGNRVKSIIDSLRLPSVRKGESEEPTSGLAIFVSVIAATLIWFMISMRESYSVVRDFQVEWVDMPSDTAFAALPPSTIST